MVTPISLLTDFGLFGLFLITFFSASLIPFPADPVIFLSTATFAPALVFLVALTGAMLGALTNYFIGLKGFHNFIVKRSPEKERKAQKVFKKWGIVALILAPWIPFIGDPLVVVAGIVRMDFRKFLLLMTIAFSIKILAIVLLGETLIPLAYSFLNL